MKYEYYKEVENAISQYYEKHKEEYKGLTKRELLDKLGSDAYDVCTGYNSKPILTKEKSKQAICDNIELLSMLFSEAENITSWKNMLFSSFASGKFQYLDSIIRQDIYFKCLCNFVKHKLI